MANVQDYLQKLLKKANEHCACGDSETVSDLYRNKPSAYFDNIQTNRANLMEKYLKDKGGDPRCPINGRLEGLFFGVTLRDGALPSWSPFGDTRVILPLSSVFDDSAKLYFADFFCMPGGADTHYVVLVITKDGSVSDRFCEQELIKLDPYNNRFLSRHGDRYQTLSRQQLWVEVFYTEHVDISSLVLTRTGVLGIGHSLGGIPKDPRCRVCNVEPKTRNVDLNGLGATRDLMIPEHQGCQTQMSRSTGHGEGNVWQMGANQMDFGYGAARLWGMGYGGSNHRLISYEGSNRRGMGYRRPIHRAMGYRGPIHREMGYRGPNNREMGYGTSNHRDVGYGGPIDREMSYGTSNHRDVGYRGTIHRRWVIEDRITGRWIMEHRITGMLVMEDRLTGR
ncbi:phytanoyl-CoA hydroxylase-interacting protein-like isoform X2 [Haliotis rubra]|uniref:phytanoyl-CoA hydroxylase-interacting protein-like isoform X2 n=1 Tax=Haliotis rubra TaxID=36100 RepID=UPI001EE5AA76|nr:phytanoyl-CoA hydroxylase-interacting protein-like isoform X2 [Haliotis rubra]